MAFWDKDDESEWEQYQKEQKHKKPREQDRPSAREKPDKSGGFFAPNESYSPEDTKRAAFNGVAQPMLDRLTALKERVLPSQAEEPYVPEKCPWCGKDMERGYIAGDRSVYWTPKKPGIFGAAANSGSFTLDTAKSLADYGCIAWLCRDCKKLTADIAGIFEIPDAIKKTMSPSDLAAAEAEERIQQTNEGDA